MPLPSAIIGGLREVVEAEIGFLTIFARQNAPRPAKPYATISLSPIQRRGPFDVIKSITPGGIATYIGHREAVAEINVFGSDSLDDAERLRDLISTDTVRETLRTDHCIAILNEGNVVDIDTILEDQYEQRSMLELRLGFAVETTPATGVGCIEKVELTNLIDEPPTTTLIEI